MSMGSRAATAQRITADAAVGTSGNVTLVYSISLGNGTDATNIALRNGTSTSGAILWQLNIASNATAESSTASISFEKPLIFTAGCYADITGTSAVAYVAYENINV